MITELELRLRGSAAPDHAITSHPRRLLILHADGASITITGSGVQVKGPVAVRKSTPGHVSFLGATRGCLRVFVRIRNRPVLAAVSEVAAQLNEIGGSTLHITQIEATDYYTTTGSGPDGTCFRPWILHELLHALGLAHSADSFAFTNYAGQLGHRLAEHPHDVDQRRRIGSVVAC